MTKVGKKDETAKIRRSARANKWTALPWDLGEDAELTAEALGLLTYVLLKPDNWTTRQTHIRERFSWGKDKYFRIVKELKEAGYLASNYIRNSAGHITGSYHVFTDQPESGKTGIRLNQNPAQPESGKPGHLIERYTTNREIKEDNIEREDAPQLGSDFLEKLEEENQGSGRSPQELIAEAKSRAGVDGPKGEEIVIEVDHYTDALRMIWSKSQPTTLQWEQYQMTTAKTYPRTSEQFIQDRTRFATWFLEKVVEDLGGDENAARIRVEQMSQSRTWGKFRHSFLDKAFRVQTDKKSEGKIAAAAYKKITFNG